MPPARQIPVTLPQKAKALLFAASKARIFFYALIWLMVLLVTGTIAEKYIGLYQAQKLFFSSFVIWFEGYVPVPGGYSTLGLIFINLLCKLIVESWSKQKVGTIIVHCGALLLLIGGGLTAIFSTEGYMAIDEGSSSAYVSDYRKHELAFIEDSKAPTSDIVFEQAQLKSGQLLASTALPFKIEIEDYFDNSTVVQRKEFLTDGSVHGMLVANIMKPLPMAAEDEKNRAGVIFHIDGANAAVNGDYALFEDMPIVQHLVVGGKKYHVELRGERTALPFEIKLIKFEKQLYPGTDKPRGYQSEVLLQDGKLQWHSLISMNNPLRYKGYTLYQSSFIEHEKNQTSVLAVVKNIGALFPYIASITICLGLLLHLIIRLPQLTARTRKS